MKLIPKLFCLLAFSFFVCSCSKESGSGDSNSALSASTGKGGSLAKFTIVGNYLYAVSNHFLYTYDISDASNPLLTNSSDVNLDIETIYPYNGNLFIGTRTGLYIYSISSPASPYKLGEASHARSCDPVVANDSIAFVTLKGNSSCGPAVSGLYIHDITNLLQPRLIRTIELPNPEGLALQGSILYVCCNDDGLKIMNVSDLENPIVIRTITGAYFKDVFTYGNLLICYVSTGIMLYDNSNPTDPVAIKLIANS